MTSTLVALVSEQFLTGLLDRFLPYKNMKIGEDFPEWADSHFLLSANERDRAIKRAHKHTTADNIDKPNNYVTGPQQ